MNSKDYWAEREAEQLKHNITEEAAYSKEIDRIYRQMLDACQKEIDGFYGRYASAEGITLAEAKKRVSQLDIAAYERKAKQYVKDKDFSAKANEEMRLYNATMKINRLEMLKANIGLELISGHDELEKFMGDILQGRTEDELKRQAGILGKSVRNNAAKAHAIVNGSFHNGTFSDRIWQYQDLMREDLGRLLQTGLIQGKNPRALAKDLRKYWFGADPKTGGGAKYCMERLMRTELARVQTEAQKQSFVRNGFDFYEFICNENPTKHGTCDICRGLNGKHFKVKDMMPGENAPPMHPHCRCSTAAWEDDDEYKAWLDHLANGGTTDTFVYDKNAVTKPQTKEEIKQQIADNKSRVKGIESEIQEIDDKIKRHNNTHFDDIEGLKKSEITGRIKAIDKRLAELDPISERYYNRPERGTDEYMAWREWRRSFDFNSVMEEQMKLGVEKADLESKLRKWGRYEEWLEWKKANPLDVLNAQRKKLVDEVKQIDAENNGLQKQLSQMVIPSSWKKITVDHDSEFDIKSANPHYSEGNEYRVNCQRCVPTYEMRRRGYDVIAKPNNAWGKGDYLSHNSNKAFENADVHWALPGTGKREIERLLKEWGEGARAEVGVSWKGANSGHVFVAENVGGKIVFIDPQSGEMDVSYYFKNVRSNLSRVWRIDNLDPSELIEECCEKRE